MTNKADDTGTAEMVWDCYDKAGADQAREFPFTSVAGPTITIDDPATPDELRAAVVSLDASLCMEVQRPLYGPEGVVGLPVQAHEWRFESSAKGFNDWFSRAQETTPAAAPIVALEPRNNKDWAEEKTLADFRRVFADERKWKALGFGRTEG